MRTRVLAGLAILALLPVAARGQGVPFPVEKSLTNKEDNQVWYVDGRQRIKSNVTIQSLRACRIVARGEEAVLEVEGKLDMRAATGGRIEFENVWIEPLRGSKGLVLLNCNFQGGGLRTAREGPCDLDIMMQSSSFAKGSRLDLDLLGGEVNIMGCGFEQQVVLRGAAEDEKSRNSLDLRITGCKLGGGGGRGGGGRGGGPSGFVGGLRLEGVREALVRNCGLAGEESVFSDCVKLTFDGNLVRSARVEFRQSEPKSFGGTDIATTDFVCDQLVLFQPASLSDPQRLRLEKCWFDGVTDEERIRAEMLRDATSDPENGVLASLFKPQEQPLGFGGRP